MAKRFLSTLLLACGSLAASTPEDASRSHIWATVTADGRLLYARDESGNRLPDFSKCGFEGGKSIPEVPVKAKVRSGSGDHREEIQNAINDVAKLAPDANGYRGAVLLEAGVFRLSGGLRIPVSGVVLRGSGSDQNGTVLRATAREKHDLITIAGPESSPRTTGSVCNIVDFYVPVGAHALTLENAAGLAVGDSVMVKRPSTAEWINMIGMNQLAIPWKPGDRDLVWERVLTGISGNTVFLNAPVTTAIDSRYGGGTLWKYEWPERISHCGVENLRGVSDTDGTAMDEDHGWVFVRVQRATDCWVRGVTSQHFGYATVAMTDNARSISVLNSECLDPISEVTGGRRYGFYMDDSQLCLVQGCRTRNDRHQFVTGSNTSGPNAFVDGISESARSDAGPHHRWANGILWDSVVLKGGELNARNRGNSGSGHGWAGANCVFWNCRADGFIVENPPTARNWCIGGVGAIREGNLTTAIGKGQSFFSHGRPVQPASLFAAQRRDATRGKSLRIRESIVGKFDGFAPDDDFLVEPIWKTKAAEQGMTPWTHPVPISAHEKIVSASISLSIRPRPGGAAREDLICIGGFEGKRSHKTVSLVTEWDDSTVLCFDLNPNLAIIGREGLNVAIAKRFSVDWAVLELAVEAEVGAR